MTYPAPSLVHDIVDRILGTAKSEDDLTAVSSSICDEAVATDDIMSFSLAYPILEREAGFTQKFLSSAVKHNAIEILRFLLSMGYLPSDEDLQGSGSEIRNVVENWRQGAP